jgi:hypothetical protein
MPLHCITVQYRLGSKVQSVSVPLSDRLNPKQFHQPRPVQPSRRACRHCRCLQLVTAGPLVCRVCVLQSPCLCQLGSLECCLSALLLPCCLTEAGGTCRRYAPFTDCRPCHSVPQPTWRGRRSSRLSALLRLCWRLLRSKASACIVLARQACLPAYLKLGRHSGPLSSDQCPSGCSRGARRAASPLSSPPPKSAVPSPHPRCGLSVYRASQGESWAGGIPLWKISRDHC